MSGKTFTRHAGEIYDRNGNLLAGNKTVYEIGLDMTAKPGYADRHACPPDVGFRPQRSQLPDFPSALVPNTSSWMILSLSTKQTS